MFSVHFFAVLTLGRKNNLILLLVMFLDSSHFSLIFFLKKEKNCILVIPAKGRLSFVILSTWVIPKHRTYFHKLYHYQNLKRHTQTYEQYGKIKV
jgi:hypothetical protein